MKSCQISVRSVSYIVYDVQCQHADGRALHTKVESLRKVRANLTSILFSSKTTLDRLSIASFASTRYQIEWTAHAEALLQKSKRQNQEQLYRLCPGVTAFLAPDSNLQSIGCESILGIRIDVLLGGKAFYFFAPRTC